MQIDEKTLRDYIRVRQAKELSKPLPPAGMPAGAGGPITGRRITGPQLIAADPLISKIADEVIQKKIRSYLSIFPVLTVLGMITNPESNEFAPLKAEMNEIAIAVIGPEYKSDTEPQSPR